MIVSIDHEKRTRKTPRGGCTGYPIEPVGTIVLSARYPIPLPLLPPRELDSKRASNVLSHLSLILARSGMSRGGCSVLEARRPGNPCRKGMNDRVMVEE